MNEVTSLAERVGPARHVELDVQAAALVVLARHGALDLREPLGIDLDALRVWRQKRKSDAAETI
ncbi:hypothetical protein [Nakamurella aerolata]|uniref:Uncharacterized protein n=1 Tax=Nakamurella aerolata TaxID=1656892 RepID=A0A849ACN9_9ACTN|nr:hypothetical protein [Nakamurella aerolata]NNG36928.1 hypothetical protein [Nakamurella aerolata]